MGSTITSPHSSSSSTSPAPTLSWAEVVLEQVKQQNYDASTLYDEFDLTTPLPAPPGGAAVGAASDNSSSAESGRDYAEAVRAADGANIINVELLCGVLPQAQQKM